MVLFMFLIFVPCCLRRLLIGSLIKPGMLFYSVVMWKKTERGSYVFFLFLLVFRFCCC